MHIDPQSIIPKISGCVSDGEEPWILLGGLDQMEIDRAQQIMLYQRAVQPETSVRYINFAVPTINKAILGEGKCLHVVRLSNGSNLGCAVAAVLAQDEGIYVDGNADILHGGCCYRWRGGHNDVQETASQSTSTDPN